MRASIGRENDTIHSNPHGLAVLAGRGHAVLLRLIGSRRGHFVTACGGLCLEPGRHCEMVYSVAISLANRHLDIAKEQLDIPALEIQIRLFRGRVARRIGQGRHEINLETVVGRSRWCVWAGGWREATTRQAHACKAERQNQTPDRTCQRVRSALTHRVIFVKGTKASIHEASQRNPSGQLRFLVTNQFNHHKS